MIASPGQFTRQAEFYHQLSQLTAAGLGIVPALSQLERNPPSHAYRESIQRLLEELAHGFTLSEALLRTGSWLPRFDITLIEAGEKSGRLDQCFRLLADHYTDRSRLAKQLIADLAYPAFILHFAIFIFPFPHFFLTGDVWWYARHTLGILIPLYAAVLLLLYALQGRHGRRWRAWMETVLHAVPVLGTARRYLALARLSAALEALISAGITIVEAWEMAAAASGSARIQRAVLQWKPLVYAGQTPAETLTASRRFPDLFASQYSTGEISGNLDETLRRLHRYYLEEGSRKMFAFARWSAWLIYLVIVLAIAYAILHFYVGYFHQVEKIGGF